MDKLLKCANFMNQEAIDEALREANRRLGEEMYTPESNVCIQCDYGLGLETSPMMLHLKMMAGHPIKRVCYKPSMDLSKATDKGE